MRYRTPVCTMRAAEWRHGTGWVYLDYWRVDTLFGAKIRAMKSKSIQGNQARDGLFMLPKKKSPSGINDKDISRKSTGTREEPWSASFFFPLSEMSLCCPRKRSVTSHYSPPPPLEQLVNATSANQCRLNETNGLHLKNTHTLRTSRIFPTDVWHSDKSRRLRLNATVRNETTN